MMFQKPKRFEENHVFFMKVPARAPNLPPGIRPECLGGRYGPVSILPQIIKYINKIFGINLLSACQNSQYKWLKVINGLTWNRDKKNIVAYYILMSLLPPPCVEWWGGKGHLLETHAKALFSKFHPSARLVKGYVLLFSLNIQYTTNFQQSTDVLFPLNSWIENTVVC